MTTQKKRLGAYFLLSCVFIAAGVLVAVISLYRVQHSIIEQERKQLLAIARSTARSIDNYIQGCMSGARLLQNMQSFQTALSDFHNTGSTESLLMHLRLVTAVKYPAVPDMVLLDSKGNRQSGTAPTGVYKTIGSESGDPSDDKFRVYEDSNGALFLGVVTEVDQDNYLVSLLDVEKLYTNTSSLVTIGEKGYVMLKHSDGLILTHPVSDQMGIDVLEGRRQRYPELDYRELEKLVSNQKLGRENIEVYHSYWWADEKPTRVKKISAYTPVRIHNDFLIVSAVQDYAELWFPIKLSSAVLSCAAILITLGVMGLSFERRRERQRLIQQENIYLRQVNRSLDEMTRHQEEAQHSQRLKMIGTLTGGIAHEFRNLLTPIMGYSGMMRESLPPDSPYRDDANEIYSSAVKAKEIIQQITSLSRKNLSPVLKPVCLDSVMQSIMKIVSATKPSEAVVEMDVNLSESRILGNKTQLNQIALNLCNNAFQAMPDGKGTLRISGWVEDKTEGRWAVITFSDDGQGMAPEVAERIFDPFFTTKKVGEGTGLGLSVVQNIVDLHHGTITVETTPKSGTTFTLRFPVIKPEHAGAETKIHSERLKAEESLGIVLVEDDETVLKMLDKGLARHGFATRIFTDPVEALAEMQKTPCRLLVTDYTLPRMTGAALAIRVKEFSPETKIVILTGFADMEILESLQKAVIDGYQIKPVLVSELVEKITSLFS